MKILSNGKLVDLPEDHPLYLIFFKAMKDIQAQETDENKTGK